MKSYQYTSMTSVMLLDCWSIPCVIILTSVFLKTRYQIRKFIGVAICIVGLVLVIFSDVHAGDRAGTLSLFLSLSLSDRYVLVQYLYKYELAGSSKSFSLWQNWCNSFLSSWYQYPYIRCWCSTAPYGLD